MVKVKDSKFYALLSVSLFAVTLLALAIGNGPLIAAQLGLSTGTAATIVNFLDGVSSVATVISIIGMFTGVGTIGSAFAATVLTILKKQGKAKAAAF
ncbi:uberolysin/carnocyclin family circular bacteriocin [Bacillus inaquosorum]|uniref:uberolysin/carnocyclin family circular bacteriocin n=1 Tax=Bacillus inaquosorum TaxID=483913 RepID=UPI002280BE67|nr:uberolysin/carnocyclin family circular bacteriocin [Bacillus inaquosorum]MCY7749228.1 uberolysin/carnocyclin family circular bacteriocin [Bacillus inaquosorum]MCY7910150.1 uberolysin/carnocyclin family circular bacteriocin [Bacillus inaquosorum]MCY8183153.1 uberolysin/carnocyclin family circular bacteriocin [Bacillus inaquosorum]MCY8502865.1 uberolysin/carnocyclin family circular bacteriocin [Bacillus inaquosorum]MCY8862757.1 uberolysin/carnocyclin family circular bacteriocin [Bacillus inaq